MLDYEDALVARYVSHYTKDGEPTGVLSDFYRDTEGREIPANLLEQHRTAKFDAHFRETAGWGEERWAEMLGFHPVDLGKYPLNFIPHDIDVLGNKTLRAWTLKQTEGIVQKRLEKDHNDMVQGALDFVHILNRSLKSTTFFKWRNDRMKPSTYVTEPEEITRLDAALNKIGRRKGTKDDPDFTGIRDRLLKADGSLYHWDGLRNSPGWRQLTDTLYNRGSQNLNDAGYQPLRRDFILS